MEKEIFPHIHRSMNLHPIRSNSPSLALTMEKETRNQNHMLRGSVMLLLAKSYSIQLKRIKRLKNLAKWQ